MQHGNYNRDRRYTFGGLEGSGPAQVVDDKHRKKMTKIGQGDSSNCYSRDLAMKPVAPHACYVISENVQL